MAALADIVNKLETEQNTDYMIVNWLEMSEHMKTFSNALRTNNTVQVKESILELIYQNIHVAKMYNIDMLSAWSKWKKKATYKKYT